jgi:hypothetical protein
MATDRELLNPRIEIRGIIAALRLMAKDFPTELFDPSEIGYHCKIIRRFGELIERAWELKCLPQAIGFDDTVDTFLNVFKGDLSDYSKHPFYALEVLGFDKVVFFNPTFDAWDEHCQQDYRQYETYMVLRPGLVGKLSPTVFQSIINIEYDDLVNRNEDDWEQARIRDSFFKRALPMVHRYYSLGCELLADAIAEEALQDKQTVVPERKPEQSLQVEYLLADDKARQEAEIVRLKSKTVVPESKPEQVGSKQNRKRGQWIGPAIAWLKRDPTLTDAAIAVKPDVNIDPSQLSRNEQWKEIRKAAAGIAQESILKGSKYDQTIDAICDETQF